MNGLSDWFQNNWIDLARLLVQCAILAAILRYGRKLLATLRASQEQIGALLKLSVSDGVEERLAAPVAEPEKEYDRFSASIAEPMKEYARPSAAIREREREPEPEPVFAGAPSRNGYAGEREQSLGGRVIGAQAPAFSASPAFSTPGFNTPSQLAESPSLTPWVSAPVSTPAAEPFRAHQEADSIPSTPPRPSASTWLQAPMRSSSVSPWRKVMRWLQAPAGH
jgi:hypothetical protein